MRHILFLVFIFILMSACSKTQNYQPNKDLTLVCSGTYVFKSKSFGKKEGNYNDEIRKFINGNYIYSDYDIETVNIDSKAVETSIGCSWTESEVNCNGVLLDGGEVHLYMNRVSGKIIENISGGKYPTTYSSEGKCDISPKKKF